MPVASLAVGMFFFCTRTAAGGTDSSAAEEFKKFLSTPPIVESVIFSERQPPDPQNPSRLDLPLSSSRSFRYYEGRFQRDAFILRELRGPDAVSDLKSTGLLVAFDGTASWFSYGPNSRNRIIDFGSGVTNEVHRSAYVTSYNLRQVLMLGIVRSMPGSVEWNGNRFRVLRSDTDFSAWGDLQVAENGLVDSLNVTHRLPSGEVHWKIRYAYHEGSATRLPSRIRCFLLQKKAEIEIADFIIYQLRLSSQTLNPDCFHPGNLIVTNRWATFIHTNNAIYTLATDGKLRKVDVGSRVLSPDEGRNHLATMPPGVYAAWAGTNVSIFAIFVLSRRMRARKSPTKT